MGPFLFCIYVNDLCTHLKHSNGYLYADDTALLVNGESVMTISNKLNDELLNLIVLFFDGVEFDLQVVNDKLLPVWGILAHVEI